MKRFLALTLAAITLFGSTTFAAAKYNDVYKDLKTMTVSGELLIEARGIFDEMGYSCTWDGNTKTTVFSDGTNSVNIVSANGAITVNGEAFLSDVKPVISDGITYIPVSVLEKLGIDVKWSFEERYPLLYDGTTYTTTDVGSWNESKTEYYVNNAKVTGEQMVDGKMYNFGSDGTLKTGIFTGEDGLIYGYDNYGNAYNGFLTRDGKKYYFNNGIAYTKPTAINGKMYNFSSEGTFVVGWSQADGKKMYYNEFGYPVVGIVDIDGHKYYFIDGVMQTGAFTYNNNNYLLNDDGTMVVDKQIGNTYYGSDGIGHTYSDAYMKLQTKAKSIIASIGTSPKAIYNYVVGHVRYKYMAQQDWTTMANVGFNTGRGACYNFAACVDILLKEAGYETRVVRGTGHYTSLHYWNQVKINGSWTNIDACNKYYNVSDAYLKGKTYTFNKYEYPTYY